MDSLISAAEFCEKYQVKRHLLNYQFKLEKIERNNDKKFDEQKMLGLLDIKEENNVEIQHLKMQVKSLSYQVEYLKKSNLKSQQKIVNIKSSILETTVHIGLSLIPQTQALAVPASALAKLIYQTKSIKEVHIKNDENNLISQ